MPTTDDDDDTKSLGDSWEDLRVVDDGARPLIPFNTVGLPPPGPNFVAAAQYKLPEILLPLTVTGLRGQERDDAIATNINRAAGRKVIETEALRDLLFDALYTQNFSLPMHVKGRGVIGVPHLSGTTFGWNDYGPIASKVMVIGKWPGRDEIATGVNFVGMASDPLYRALRELQLADIRRNPDTSQVEFNDVDKIIDWYWTSACKHVNQNPSSTGVPKASLSDGLWLLAHEIRLVRPKYILCLGSEATKQILGSKETVTKMYGRVEDRRFAIHVPGETPEYLDVQVMAIPNPASTIHDPKYYPDLVNGLGQFAALVNGNKPADRRGVVRHVTIYTAAVLEKVVDEILAGSTGTVDEPGVSPIAVDCEWHGDVPGESRSYLRTVQFSHKAGRAYCVVLRAQHGKPSFKGGLAAARYQLNRLLKSSPTRTVRVGGHWFRADLPWLLHFGVDCRDEFRVADTPEATRYAGGWDTGYMAHAYYEVSDGGHKLENLAARFLGIPRYDLKLQKWKDEYCRTHGLKDKELEGYGDVSDDILYEYANWDVDSTFRLFELYGGKNNGKKPGLLDSDRFGNSCREMFFNSHSATMAALQMEMTGLEIDGDRGDDLTAIYSQTLDALLPAFRERIAWEKFNPNSATQCRELLFGRHLNGTIDNATGLPKRLAPPGAARLKLEPIKAAGSKGKIWERVISDGEIGVLSPSTDKETLEILSKDDSESGRTAGMLRDLRFISQVLKGCLRRPLEDADDNVCLDEDGNLIYDGGLLYWRNEDDCVRTHFYPVETGRWSSSRPNLQNISSRREEDYKEILGHLDKNGKPRGRYTKELGVNYMFPIRSMIRARPGMVLCEIDLKMAEMAMIGILAGDPVMLDHVRRNSLPEDDPEHMDPHSNTAVKAFNLVDALGIPLRPVKSILEANGMKHRRVGAKTVNFGVPYGRGAQAIARQARSEGANISTEEAQKLIDGYHATYPDVSIWLVEAMSRSQNPGWLQDPFGGFRRFEPTNVPKSIADQERQAANAPIQGGVARYINQCCYLLENYQRTLNPNKGPYFRFLLQVHDSLLLETATENVSWLKAVTQKYMTDDMHVWPRRLNGDWIEDAEPYSLATDFSVYEFWGQKLTLQRATEIGVDSAYLTTPGNF